MQRAGRYSTALARDSLRVRLRRGRASGRYDAEYRYRLARLPDEGKVRVNWHRPRGLSVSNHKSLLNRFACFDPPGGSCVACRPFLSRVHRRGSAFIVAVPATESAQAILASCTRPDV